MRKLIAVSLTVLAAGCGGAGIPELDSLYSRQPRVVSVEPTDGAVVSRESSIAVEFSEPIDPSTVDSSTLAVVRFDEGAEDPASSIVMGDAKGLPGVYEFAGEGRVAVFHAAEPYDAGAAYKVVATTGIQSIEMLPLAGRYGSAKPAFTSEFVVEEWGASADGAGGGDSGGSSSGSGSQGSQQIKRPSFLLINELLYDVPGEDTNGVLFIELYGEALTSIGSYKILFINGDNGATIKEVAIPKQSVIPEDGIFLIADSMTGQSGVSQIQGTDLIDNFDPQNGPDCVQLLDDKGALVDALGYGTPIMTPAANGKPCFEGTPAPKVDAGTCLSRAEGVDTDDNSADFHASAPTPGVM